MSGNKVMRVRQLFKEMLSHSEAIKDYNFRHYFIRRTTQVTIYSL